MAAKVHRKPCHTQSDRLSVRRLDQSLRMQLLERPIAASLAGALFLLVSHQPLHAPDGQASQAKLVSTAGAGASGVKDKALAGPYALRPKALRSASLGPGEHWVLSLNEQFDHGVDRRLWSTAFKNAGSDADSLSNRSLYGNRERQVYVDRDFLGLGLQPFSHRHGVLTITARPMSPRTKKAVAAALAQEKDDVQDTHLKDVAYTSGMISTRGRFAQAYGYFEMRARWPAGKGLWPAFWLLPTHGGWPPEIDVMESVGSSKGMDVFQTVHSKAAGKHRSKTKKITKLDVSAFHTYAVMWTPQELIFFIDGVETSRHPTPKDAHSPKFLIINLAVGGKWPGEPNSKTPMPARMDIDFVRVWRLEPQRWEADGN